MENAVPQLHDYLSESAQRFPDKVALVCQQRRETYRDLDRASNALAHALVRRGVSRGDRVVVLAENSVEAVIAFFGVLKANAVVCMVNADTKAGKLTYLLNDCRAIAMITPAHLAETVSAAARNCPHLRAVVAWGEIADVDLDAMPFGVRWAPALEVEPADQAPRRQNLDIDLAAIIYTSGSTGEAKGVMLTHHNMRTAARSISTYLEMREDDVILGVLPLSFDYGLYQLIMVCRVGARLVLERSFTYPVQALNQIVSEGVTGFPGVPTIFAILAEFRHLDRYDFSKVRFVTNTAAAITSKHIDLLRRIFSQARVFSMYGLTECKRCTYLPPDDIDRKPGSVGIAIPDTEIWIVDDRGQRVGPGEVGQLVVRGATVMRGYWEKPEETAKKLRPGPLSGEMVLYTGDYCRFDDDGYLYFVGRMDDIIKSRGEKVAPREIEDVIVNIDGVKEAAVIGVPDDKLGQAIKAFVVLEHGCSIPPREIHNECVRRLETVMVPKFIEITAQLPKTSSGKISKVGLA